VTGEIRIGHRQRIGALIVHPQAIHFGEEIIADGTVDGPILHEALLVLQYLLDVNPPVRQKVAQACEVGVRIAQAVRMIDPQAVDLALRDHRLDARVRGGKHLRQLGTNAAQGADVEEASVIGELTCELPAVEHEKLVLQNFIQHPLVAAGT
jgi:hypothetical protein